MSFAAEHRHEVIVNLLLEKGVEIDSKDKSGWTPLLYAIKRGHEQIASLLVSERTFKVYCENENGRTLLFLATRQGFNTIVQRLLQYDDIDLDKFRTAPLLCAVENGDQDIFEKLPTGSWRYKINGKWVYVKRKP